MSEMTTPSPAPVSRRAPHPFARELDEAIDRYHEILTAYVDRGGDDHVALVDRMVERGAVYGGRPICSFLRPQFILRRQYDMITQAVRCFRSAVVKAKGVILQDPTLLEEMALTDGERRLLEINPEFKS